MRSPRHSLILVVACWLGVAASLLAAEFSFVNDFEAVEWEDEWEWISYPGIVIDDYNRVTLFWNSRIPNPLYSPYNQIYYRRLDASGLPLSGNVMVTDSTRHSNFAALFPGSNYQGKWAFASPIFWTYPECWPFCYNETRSWFSDASGDCDDTGFTVGAEVESPLDNDMGAGDVDSTGNFVIVWNNLQTAVVWCQLFDPDGTPLTDTIRVQDGSYPEDPSLRYARRPQVAMAPEGDFVVVFQAECDLCEPGDWITDIFARPYNADGTPKTDLLCATCWGDSTNHIWNGGTFPSVAIQNNGDYAISWVQYMDNCNARTVLRRFYADGTPKGQQVVIDSSMCSMNTGCWVASDSVGNLVAAWQNNRGSSNQLGNLFAQRYNPSGEAVGEKFQVNDGYMNVDLPLSPVALNNNGMVAFFWLELDETTGRFPGMAQFMDLEDVGVYVSCDANNDRLVNITDAVFLINYIFNGGVPPAHECLGNANGDELVNITDAVALISYIFSNGDIVEGCPD